MSSGSVLRNAPVAAVPEFAARCLGRDEHALAILNVTRRPLTGGREVAARQIAASRGIRVADAMRLVATPYRIAILADRDARSEVLNSVPYAEITTLEVSRDGLRCLVLIGIRGVPIYLRGRRGPARDFAATVSYLRSA